MINRPTQAEILLAIGEELRAVVTPAVTDPQAHMTLGLTDALLRLVSARTTSDQRLMREEIDAIDSLAIANGVEAHQPGARGLDASPAPGEELTERYYAASRQLATVLEDDHHPNYQDALAILRQRLVGEVTLAGALTLVGRVGAEELDALG